MDSIRLITTYTEAKALKEAGWPQPELCEGALYYDFLGQSRYCIADYSPPDCIDDFDCSAVRLDELLVFLIERRPSGTLDWLTGVPTQTVGRFAVSFSADEMFKGDDLLAAVVDAVLRVLTNTPTS